MKFDDHFIEAVRSRVDIVELIGSYVQLKKSGQNYLALCPFHTEKTPSFSVSDSKQIFKCFGCGIGGDVFQFICHIERLSFPEAIRHLAERGGIPLPETGAKTDPDGELRPRLFRIMQLADDFFGRSLVGSEVAQSYLKQRQIEPETLRLFGVGYAPGGNRLLPLLKDEGFALKEIEACGLVKQSEAGDYYDKFRNRITFPIRDLNGRTIAFGGRILGEAQPKYLNSPETPLYVKGRNLYGLSVAKEGIRHSDFAILVEGYFDCVVPFQFGIRNVVASLGTSLTEGQVRLLGRFTRKAVVNFDPDSAGVAASMRSIDLFLAHGFEVNVLCLPKGQDPDSFILNNGVDAYQAALKSSLPYLDFMLSHFLSRTDPRTPRGKREVAAQILPYLLKIPNRVERSEYLSKVASRLRVREEPLIAEMRKLSRRDSPRSRVQHPIADTEATMAEMTLLVGVFEESHQTEILTHVFPELFEGLRTENIFKGILGLKNQNREISVLKLRDLLDVNDVDLLERVTLESSGGKITWEIIQGSVAALRDLQADRLSREIQEEILREEQNQVASARLSELLRKKETLRRQKYR